MITRAVIENFQSHQRTVLELHPGLNVIVGSSDSGKSALFRALLWPITNKPTGDSFRSTWADKHLTSVSLELDDGSVVTRAKGKKENLYKLGDTEFRSFNQDVPAEIAEALGVGLINIQEQHDSPFFLSENPGERGRILNRIVKLEEIDSSISKVNGEVRIQNAALADLKERQLRLAEELTPYADLEALIDEAQAIVKMEGQALALQTQGDHLLSCINGLIAIENAQEGVQEVLQHEQAVKDALALQERLTQLHAAQEALARVTVQIGMEEGVMARTARILKHADEVPLIEAEVWKLKQVAATAQGLFRLKVQLKEEQTRVERTAKALSVAEEAFRIAMPDVCPLCEQEIHHA